MWCFPLWAIEHYNILFILRRNHSVADRWKSIAIQCPRQFQISLLIERHWLNQSTDLQNRRGLKRSMTISDCHRTTWSPLSPIQSPLFVTKITVADCCWHGRWCGAYMDYDVAPTWMMIWHLRGWWHHHRSSLPDVHSPARKKAGPQFFQPISKLQFKNMKPNSKITIPYIFIILYTQLEWT